MHAISSYQALFVDSQNGELMGLRAFYVDELMRAETDQFRPKIHATTHRFYTTETDDVPFEFTGFIIERLMERRLEVIQNSYLRNLEYLS